VGLDLSSADAIGCHYNRWLIRQGHDINDLGWIVGYAEYVYPNSPNVPTGKYLVLLTPCTPCVADMNCSGCVDIDDHLAVINSWNHPCLTGPCALADSDCNYVVNIDDLLAVINLWCPDVCNGEVCCEGCRQCQEGGGFMSGMNSANGETDGFEVSNPPTLEELIMLILQSPLPADAQAEIITQLLAN
jgi:hypothetical protein